MRRLAPIDKVLYKWMMRDDVARRLMRPQKGFSPTRKLGDLEHLMNFFDAEGGKIHIFQVRNVITDTKYLAITEIHNRVTAYDAYNIAEAVCLAVYESLKLQPMSIPGPAT